MTPIMENSNSIRVPKEIDFVVHSGGKKTIETNAIT